jgi:hypothetical protein
VGVSTRHARADEIEEGTTMTETANTTKTTKTAKRAKTSRYNAAYAKAYRAARRREAEEFPILITLDF